QAESREGYESVWETSQESFFHAEGVKVSFQCQHNSLVSVENPGTPRMVRAGVTLQEKPPSPSSPHHPRQNLKFLGMTITKDLKWDQLHHQESPTEDVLPASAEEVQHVPGADVHIDHIVHTIESILSSCITSWFGNCTASDRQSLQRVVRTAEKIIGVSLPTIMDIYTTRCIRKATSIVDDHTHPLYTLFTLLPSGKGTEASGPSHPDCATASFPKPSDSLTPRVWSE
ncbi:hypothetical protein NFI96_027140, partial [Prochilodus magdalenae]